MSANCGVCGIPSTSTKPIFLHYGSVLPSCSNCKLFFKRCNQECMNETGLKYKCIKMDPGKCLVSNELSKKQSCKECKFLKCLAVGMDPTKILGVEDRRKFVRKVYRKGSDQATDEYIILKLAKQEISAICSVLSHC